MKVNKSIKLFSTVALTTAALTVGSSSVFADATVTRNTENDSAEIISDPYSTYDAAESKYNEIKYQYLENYGDYIAGINPTEDLKNYEVYAILRGISLNSKEAEETISKVTATLTNNLVPTPKPQPETNTDKENVTPSDNVKEISGEFTEVIVNTTGVKFKSKLSEALPHAGSDIPNIKATLTEKVTGKEIANSVVVLEGLSDDFNDQFLNPLLYSNLLRGIIYVPSLNPGNYILTVDGMTGAPYGANSDKKKRHFVFSTDVTLTGKDTVEPILRPELPKDDQTKPSQDPNKNYGKGSQQPITDKNNQTTTDKKENSNSNSNKLDENKVTTQNTNKTSTPVEIRTTASTLTSKQEFKKDDKKNILPNTGERTTALGTIGVVLFIVSLGLVVKRKRG